MCACKRDHDEHRRDRDLDGQPGRDDHSALDPVGKVASRQREDRQRHEFREPDEPEIERVAVDGVDLPTDRDDEHLERESVGERGDPEQCEVAQLERGGQAVLHERER